MKLTLLGAALFSLAGFALPAFGQVPDPATTPRLAVPTRGVAAPLPGQPTTAPAAAPHRPEPAPVTAAPPPSGVTQVPPAAAAPATASSSQAATGGQRPVVCRGKFGLTLDGVPIGWAKSVEGGDASADVVVEKAGPDHISAKHLSNIKYVPIAVVTDLPSRTLTDWIAGSWKGNAVQEKRQHSKHELRPQDHERA